MSIKSGELIHVGNQVLVDRAQTAGPGTLNINRTKIYELGNYESVGEVRDTPDLSFTLESLDATASLEALLTGAVDVQLGTGAGVRSYQKLADGTEFKLRDVLPIDVASQFKAGKTSATPFDVVGSVAIPFLMPSSIEYRFGIRDNATQSVTLSGDALYFAKASAYIEEVAGTNTAAQDIPFAHTAIVYNGDKVAGPRYALAVTLVHSQKRLTAKVDYTETATGIVVTEPVPTTERIRVIYQSTTPAASYPQASHAPTEKPGAAVVGAKPAALRGRDIEVRIGGTAVTDRWSSVQSVSATWSVSLDKDEEFGNPNVISQDFDVPEVRGTIEIKPRDYNELISRVQQVAGVDDGEVVGPLTTNPLPLEILLHSPVTGDVLKTIYVPDASFTVPGFTGRVQTKMTVSFEFQSDGGNISVFKGERP